jgi:hypothetical protein
MRDLHPSRGGAGARTRHRRYDSLSGLAAAPTDARPGTRPQTVLSATPSQARVAITARTHASTYEPGPCSATGCPIRWTPSRARRSASRYLPVRSRCLHPGQQQGRRWPSSSSSWVRRMRRSRVVCCLASSTQQMNSLRAKGVMSLQASKAAVLAISASRRSAGSVCTTPTRHSLAAHTTTVAASPLHHPSTDITPPASDGGRRRQRLRNGRRASGRHKASTSALA